MCGVIIIIFLCVLTCQLLARLTVIDWGSVTSMAIQWKTKTISVFVILFSMQKLSSTFPDPSVFFSPVTGEGTGTLIVSDRPQFSNDLDIFQ